MPSATPATVRCDSCGLPIFWAMSTTDGGRRIPIDERPVADGNVIVTGNPRSLADRTTLTATVLGPLEALMHDGELYVTHFATCPDADAWKGTTRAERRRPLKEHA